MPETVASTTGQEAPFGAALESGVELLRALDRRRSGVAAARRAAATWAAAHPELDAQLVVDVRPGTPVVDYDLVVAHPGGGTVALTAPPEDGISWPVDHSTHWAANQLVSVDGVHLSLPDAFLMLRGLTGRNGSPHDDIVDHCLLVAASRDEPLVDGDLQEAADAFRRRRGLHGRQATLAWLDRMSMTAEQFEEEVTALARRIRFRRRKEAELAPGYLARHRGDFDRVKAAWVSGPRPFPAADAAEFLANLPCVPADEGAAEATLCERVASDLPEPLRGAPARVVIGPLQPEAWHAGARSIGGRPSYQEGRGGAWSSGAGGGMARSGADGDGTYPSGAEGGRTYFSGVVLDRRPAAGDDPAVLAAAGRAAFAEWLAERRARASVTWHWL
ncbi:TIGR04500 family putative peptide maturation system protein [Microtetraspora malaysiensis]|uniref:TIGR04500 family putative peptide maturation system protein n=1 Tax=Microtetraspora malaysiensis TaxID=161358 RepID=UPI003D93079F